MAFCTIDVNRSIIFISFASVAANSEQRGLESKSTSYNVIAVAI